MKLAWRFNRKTVVLIMALVFGGLGAVGAHHYLNRTIEEIRRQDEATESVIVARTELASGAEITPDTVSIRQVPVEWVQSGALRPGDFERVERGILKTPLAQGEMLMWPMIEEPGNPSVSAMVGQGRRAVTLPVDEISSLAGMLRPGDRIDLVVTVDGDNGPRSYPVLQRVRVLATGSNRRVGEPSPEEAGAGGYTTITLDTSPEEAQRLITARDGGRLTAMLRHPGDMQVVPGIAGNTGRVVAGGWASPSSPLREGAMNGVRIVYGDKL